MKKRWLVVLILTLACIAVVLTVSWQLTSVDKLLRPPRPYGEDFLVQQAFEEHLSSGYQLKNANRGRYNTAYNYVDVDGSGMKIAVVSYSIKKNPKELCISVLHKNGDKWECIADLPTGCSDIEYIDFLDINNDSKKEIIVQCSLQSVLIYNHLLLYEISEQNNSVSVKKIYECDYELIRISDIDSDGLYEFIKADSVAHKNINRYKLSVLKFNESDFSVCDSIYVNKGLKTLSSMRIDKKFNNDVKMIYLDGYNTFGTAATYFYLWDNTSGKLAALSESNPCSRGLVRNMSIGCKDADKDGFIEFPSKAFLADSEIISSDDLKDSVTTVLWSRVDKFKNEDVIYHVYNNEHDYTLVLDKALAEKLTFVYNADENVFTVYTLNTNGKRDKKVFSVYSVEKELNKYEKIFQKDNYSHYFVPHNEAMKYGFDIEKIKELIFFR